ncbi:anti-sigma regulatory factor (Ser/Thr protein kinase) [Allocatelliglobosispora scoriae]|uniref:Anti-sigma regulatory factor (Ser/Thr protein kinase) n=1 Tax=Allocatelliglobosispora scoriae TaxID=643052 RepID=A0A841BJZ1_9ACTN|nr:ATP-binding protein [Allocatelliglobosispora scoriae]MBB5867658.1 anti-sigma regulatory factor (Ser/Thr protein kinase) [Allocatelliglobosispora scoriae]
MHADQRTESPWAVLVGTDPVAVVQVGGAIQRGQSARLCQQIVEVVGAQSGGAVLDLTELTHTPQAPPEALAPLPGLFRAFAGRVVAICGRPSWLRPPRLPGFRDQAEATRHVLAADEPLQLKVSFERVLEASSAGRQLVTDACEEWDLPSALTGPAQLVVTELVNNAILHAGTSLSLTVTQLTDSLHIAVHDGSTVLPAVRRPAAGPLPSAGRGLTLIEAFASAWGATGLADGKIVWAELQFSR